MDQMASACGQTDHALLIDCRSLEVTPVPLPQGAAIVVLDTTVRRGLVDLAYNQRRAQCEAAARVLDLDYQQYIPLQQFVYPVNPHAKLPAVFVKWSVIAE